MVGPFQTRSWYDCPIFEDPFTGFDCVQDLELTDDRDYTVEKPGRGRLFNVLDARHDRGYYDPCIGLLEIKQHDEATYRWLNVMLKKRRSGELESRATLVFFGEKSLRQYPADLKVGAPSYYTQDMLCCLAILTSREFQQLNWNNKRWQLERMHCRVYDVNERFSLAPLSNVINQHGLEGCSDSGEHLSCMIIKCRDGGYLIDIGMSLDKLADQVDKFVLNGYVSSKHIVDVSDYVGDELAQPLTDRELFLSQH